MPNESKPLYDWQIDAAPAQFEEEGWDVEQGADPNEGIEPESEYLEPADAGS
jgi:hypothetical protein